MLERLSYPKYYFVAVRALLRAANSVIVKTIRRTVHTRAVSPQHPSYRLYNWKPFWGTNLLEVSIGRDLGALNPFGGQIYLKLVWGGIWGH